MNRKSSGLLRCACYALLFALFIAATAFSFQTKDDLSLPIPPDPKVKTGKLANGITYYIRENKKPENRAELRLVVNAGSVLEDSDQQGLAHLCEHMAFKGTKRFKKQQIIDYMQSIGMRFGADINAYTDFDETVYHLPSPPTGIRSSPPPSKSLRIGRRTSRTIRRISIKSAAS